MICNPPDGGDTRGGVNCLESILPPPARCVRARRVWSRAGEKARGGRADCASCLHARPPALEPPRAETPVRSQRCAPGGEAWRGCGRDARACCHVRLRPPLSPLSPRPRSCRGRRASAAARASSGAARGPAAVRGGWWRGEELAAAVPSHPIPPIPRRAHTPPPRARSRPPCAQALARLRAVAVARGGALGAARCATPYCVFTTLTHAALPHQAHPARRTVSLSPCGAALLAWPPARAAATCRVGLGIPPATARPSLTLPSPPRAGCACERGTSLSAAPREKGRLPSQRLPITLLSPVEKGHPFEVRCAVTPPQLTRTPPPRRPRSAQVGEHPTAGARR